MAQCDALARHSEEPSRVSRPFPSRSMQHVHDDVGGWMRAAGMSVRVDAIGNLIGHYPGDGDEVLLIGSHLDSVPDAGKYDGILGVLLGTAVVRALAGKRLPFGLNIIGFCEEEGIRFRVPYLGSRALAGCFDPALLEKTDAAGISLAAALSSFGLNPARVCEAAYPASSGRLLGYLEAHIEQGPVLENRDLPLGVVEAIAGQTRMWLRFVGRAGHAGTMPMELRHDALAAAAELIVQVEAQACAIEGLRATIGTLTVAPGAVNVVPGSVALSLDVRHADDSVRLTALTGMVQTGEAICRRRGLELRVEQVEHHPAVAADGRLRQLLVTAATQAGHAPLAMVSGAGHDAAIMATVAPMAMLFVRSPGGISHHPDEAVLPADVEAALQVMVSFVEQLSGDLAWNCSARPAAACTETTP